MNERAKIKAPAAPETVTTGPIAGSHKVYASPKGHADIRVPFREIALSDPNEPPVRVYDASGPYSEADARVDLAAGLKPVREAWISARGYAAIAGRAIKPEDNGSVSTERLAPHCPAKRTLRAGAPGQLVTQFEFARAGIVTEEMIYVAHRENLAREAAVADAQGTARRRRKLRRGDPRIRHAGIRALGSRARPRDHPRQHQPRRARADGDRPQLPGQGQRQHRQQRGELRRRRGSREDGVGDPLGRRHGDGPLHRPQHPQHPLLDRAQLARADRHRADLPGAGEGRRRSAQARLGSVQGHADRAGRAGRRLFHHPRRRAARLCAAHRQARDRHRLARRLDHGALVPRRPSRELPLRALRRHLRHHAQVRRLVLARRRPAARLERRRQRRGAIRRAGDARRVDQGRLGQGLPGDDRGPRPCADAQDQGQHGQAARGLRRGAVLYAWAR